MTRNFKRVFGKGGLGVVYHGDLNHQKVAVKMLNRAFIYNTEEFTTGVEEFVKVYHRNLVRLTGYCDESDHDLALIYEFMENGDLKDHLSGKFGNVVSWESRLKISIGVAKGLCYLHGGFTDPIIHRFVKPTNILLDRNFEPKLADSGMSPNDPETHFSKKIYVNPGRSGYMDDQYLNVNWLTESSDVYSFGIVLLEMITNQPVIDNNRESPHISKWVDLKVAEGHTLEIVDPRLNNDFDTSSVCKAIEIALACAANKRGERPIIFKVEMVLQECLALEMARRTQGKEITQKTH